MTKRFATVRDMEGDLFDTILPTDVPSNQLDANKLISLGVYEPSFEYWHASQPFSGGTSPIVMRPNRLSYVVLAIQVVITHIISLNRIQ